MKRAAIFIDTYVNFDLALVDFSQAFGTAPKTMVLIKINLQSAGVNCLSRNIFQGIYELKLRLTFDTRDSTFIACI